MAGNELSLLTNVFEHQPHQYKVYRHGDGKHGEGCPPGWNAQIEEEVEQADVQPVVHGMCAAETSCPLPRRTGTESEIGREIEIGYEADKIAHRISYIYINIILGQKVLQQVVDAIMKGSGHHAYQRKA